MTSPWEEARAPSRGAASESPSSHKAHLRRLLGARCWVLGAGCRVPAPGPWKGDSLAQRAKLMHSKQRRPRLPFGWEKTIRLWLLKRKQINRDSAGPREPADSLV